jgi:hypothetical protein
MSRLLFTVLLCSSLVLAQVPAQTTLPSAHVAVTQASTADPATALIVAKALAALSTTPVHSAVITGTATADAGSTHESGTFNLQLKSTGESNFSLNAGTLTRTEITGPLTTASGCTWAGGDGVRHKISNHNCRSTLNPFAPVLTLVDQAGSTNVTSSLAMDANGAPVVTLTISKSFDVGDASVSALLSHLSTVKLSLDGTTFLPLSLSFNAHPDKNPEIDIPMTIKYSDYRKVSGATVPFHIQKFIHDNGLTLDLQVENVTIQ